MSVTSPRQLPAEAAAPRSASRLRTRWANRFVASDPGLNRFRMALQSVLTIGVILVAERIFVSLTHALQVRVPAGAKAPAAHAAQITAANHDFLVIAMLLGAIVGMMSSFGVMDKAARGQLITTLFLPVPMTAALTLGMAIGGDRVLALASLAVLLAAGTYCRRFGPRGFIAGMLLFMGDFFGFFLHGEIAFGDLGWLVAEIGVGIAVALLVRFTLFYPRQARALERTQRSYAARARKAAALALGLFDNPGFTPRDGRRLQRQLVRLNEAALMIDAQLGDDGAVTGGSSAQLLHQRLFDAELSLTNLTRFAQAMARMDLPAGQRSEARKALAAVCRHDLAAARQHAGHLARMLRTAGPGADDDQAVIVAHRFAGSVTSFADAMTEWMAAGETTEGQDAFQPSVTLFGGWLPGSANVSNTASLEPGSGLGSRAALARYSRNAIQIGIAVGAATAVGDLLSGKRFYWAVIAAFITFMGANSSGEQVRKAIFRVAGTVVGIAIGSLLVDVVGRNTYLSVTVILVALFLGFYLMRINYAFMVIGITVMISQLYVQLDEFSNALLLLRLEETAAGAAIAIAVVLLVFPLRTRRVLRVAVRDHVQAVTQLAGDASDRLLGAGRVTGSTLRSDARAVDAAYQALLTTAQPLRRTLGGAINEDTGRALRLAAASRNYSRNLVADTAAAGVLPAGLRPGTERASATLRHSLEIVSGAITGRRDVTYTRSAALFDQTERRLEESASSVSPAQLAIRDLKLIDATMASLAEHLGLALTDFDTHGPAAGYRRGAALASAADLRGSGSPAPVQEGPDRQPAADARACASPR